MVRFMQIFLRLDPQGTPIIDYVCRVFTMGGTNVDDYFPNHEVVLAYYVQYPSFDDFFCGTMIHVRHQRIDIFSKFYSWYCPRCQHFHHHFTKNVIRMPDGNFRIFCNCRLYDPTNHNLSPDQTDIQAWVVPAYDEDGMGQLSLISRCLLCRREHTYEMESRRRYTEGVRRVTRFRCSGDLLNSGEIEADYANWVLARGGRDLDGHMAGGHAYDTSQDLRFLCKIMLKALQYCNAAGQNINGVVRAGNHNVGGSGPQSNAAAEAGDVAAGQGDHGMERNDDAGTQDGNAADSHGGDQDDGHSATVDGGDAAGLAGDDGRGNAGDAPPELGNLAEAGDDSQGNNEA